MRRTQFWILALFAVVFLIPATFCSANTNTAISPQVFDNDAQVVTIAPDALTAGTSTADAVSSETIISTSTGITCEAAGRVDQFTATTSKTYAENELTINNNTAEESSWIAKQTIAVTVGSEGRANATFLAGTLASVPSSFEVGFSGNPLVATSTRQEAQNRSNAQTDAALITDTKTAADAREQNANTTTTRTYKNDENSIPMSTTANTCDDFAVTAGQNTDVANIANGQYVGTMAQIALTTNAAWQGRYHVIKPNFNGMTRA